MKEETKILVIPRHLVLVRFVDIPSVDESEIEKMLEFQAIKEIPYPKEEMIFSYRDLGSYREGFTSTMLVITKREVIEGMMQKSISEVESIKLHTELLYLFLLEKEVISAKQVNFVVHIGREDSELMVIDKTRPLFSRGFLNTEKFLDEVERSSLAYERDRSNPAIENVIVTHLPNIDIGNIRQYVKERFNKLPVGFFEFSEDLSTIELSTKIELLPREISYKKARLQKSQELLLTFSLIALILILFFGFFSFKVYEKKRVLNMLSLRFEQIDFETTRLENFLKKIEIAKNHLERGRLITEILGGSYNLAPVTITFSGLSYDGRESLFYKGTSKDMSSIFAFVKKLQELKYFESVEVKHATKKKVKSEEVTDFNIQCKIKSRAL